MNIQKIRTSNLAVKAVIYSILLLVSTNSVLSQQNDSVFSAKSTFYTNFSTKGAIYSLNYDRIFHQSDKIIYTYRIGFSVLKEAIALPVGINLLSAKGNSHAEFSLTIMPYIDQYRTMFSTNDLSDKYLYVIPAIGYRYQITNGGLFFKAALSPMLVLDPPSSNFWKMDPKMYFTGNIGIGLSF